uniref:Uncharacterized protein At2g26810 n=1 Tax=Arabidopsis thaliana TaxID=3702 RepID=O81026_ARATH|nr:hypothetical protein [Arabidopsis thaliana]
MGSESDKGREAIVEEEEEEIVCLESFFINDDYQLTKFTFGSHVLELYCLQSASRQLVWPGAMLMNGYLSENADILQGCSVLELGSGVELEAAKLEWGNSDQLGQILKKHNDGFDLILGAEIYILIVEQLLRIRGQGNCKFILAYVSRARQ